MNTIYLETAVSLARQAGEIGRTIFTTARESTWKSDNTPVTEADIAINDLVIREISRIYPNHAIIGEESSQPHAGADHVWVCD